MQNKAPQLQGFDATVKTREEDHLNRWPFAREIYGIATTGPRDWSVRIGIYGEWGTGKTSVLDFITAMAKRDGHIVIPFNPWQFSSNDELWRAFVTKIYKEPVFSSMERAGWVRTKKTLRWLLDRGKTAKEGLEIVSETGGKAAGVGLDIVKNWFSFSDADLQAVRDKLGDKRIIILIDDLDRTAPQLVPEILFALKELMNVAGFSFICAFDPTVVGKVLRQYHRGFGDGLKFLEKIIDYPRWLPPPSAESLADLAVADAKHYCPYIPESDLRRAIPLLPPNPRSVRQFIRLLKLLGPQINRHDKDELHWPTILTANVIKIRYPNIGNAVLSDPDFWHKIEGIRIMDRSNEQTELLEAVRTHIESIEAHENSQLNAKEKSALIKAMLPLCSDVSMFLAGGAEAQVYQMNIAEYPHAVTGMEFNRFRTKCERDFSAAAVRSWIEEHAKFVERTQREVNRELFHLTLKMYLNTLAGADNVRLDEERFPVLQKAESLLSILTCLVLDLGQIDQSEKIFGSDEVEALFEGFAGCVNGATKSVESFCERNEKLLEEIIQRWSGDIWPLINAIVPYGYWGPQRYQGKRAMGLHERLARAIKPRLAAVAITGMRDSGFMDRIWPHEKEASQLRCLFMDHAGALWKDARAEILAVLRDAANDFPVQENSFELLHFFDFCMRQRGETGDGQNVKTLLEDIELSNAVWAAATARPLSPYLLERLNGFAQTFKSVGLSVPVSVSTASAEGTTSAKPQQN